MKNLTHLLLSCLMLASLSACDDNNDALPHHHLQVVIIRHAEKPEHGENLSCQGLNRALALPKVLSNQFNKPDVIYVPALKADESTSHARMFQTITPFAVKYNLTINSQFKTDAFNQVRKNVFKQEGTVLLVWSHSEIQQLAKTLGVKKAPLWADEDFDSIWSIDYKSGQANLSILHEGLQPLSECLF